MHCLEMKCLLKGLPILLIVMCFAMALNGVAQEVKIGKVVLDDKSATPVADVAIKFKDHPYYFSRTDGLFEYAVSENYFTIEAIHKPGYQLIAPTIPYTATADKPLVIVMRFDEDLSRKMIRAQAQMLDEEIKVLAGINLYDSIVACLDRKVALDSENIRWQYETGLFLQKHGDYQAAMDRFGNAVKKAEELYGKNNQWMAVLYENCGDNYMVWDAWKDVGFGASELHFADAKTYYEMANQVWYVLLGENNYHIADLFNKVGRCWIELNNSEEALPFLDRALALFQSILGVNNHYVASVYFNMVLAYDDMNKYDETRQSLQKWLEVIKNLYGESSESYQKASRTAESFLKKMQSENK